MQDKRQYNLDFLRILACFMVLILHVSGHNWSKISPQSIEWQVFNVYDVLVRSAVPLFFMLSGKLFLSKEEISLKKLFLKNISKLLFVYFFWSLFYAVDLLGFKNTLTSPNLSNILYAFLSSKYHLWYLPALISVYLLVPVFISMKSYKNGRILDYTAVLFFIFSILGYSILLLPIGQAYKEFLQSFSFIFDTYCGYFLFGHIFDRYSEKLKRIPTFVLLVVFFITIVVTAAGSYFLSVKAGTGISTLYSYFFISTFIEAAVIFMLFLRLPHINIGKTVGTIIKKISKYTLFVYLFHPFVIEHLDLWFGVDSLSFAPILSVPLIAILLFVVCIIIAVVLDKIPVVRKIFL